MCLLQSSGQECNPGFIGFCDCLWANHLGSVGEPPCLTMLRQGNNVLCCLHPWLVCLLSCFGSAVACACGTSAGLAFVLAEVFAEAAWLMCLPWCLSPSVACAWVLCMLCLAFLSEVTAW